MDLAEAIEKSSKAANLISSDLAMAFCGNTSSLPGVGLSFNRDNEQYCLVFHLTNMIYHSQVIEICDQLELCIEKRDIKIIGKAFALPGNVNPIHNRDRPIQRGSYISRTGVPGGTMGCFVQEINGSDKLFLLSCTHVLAPFNKGISGDIIFQPGGSSINEDSVAKLHSFIPLKPTSTDITTSTKHHFSLDAAIAEIICPETLTGVKTSITLKGDYAESELPSLLKKRTKVFKIGSSTKSTSGFIVSIGMKKAIAYEGNILDGEGFSCLYNNLLFIESDDPNKQPFSGPGDSGSLIYDEDGYAVGLLIGGISSGNAYALPIEPILNHFQVKLVLS